MCCRGLIKEHLVKELLRAGHLGAVDATNKHMVVEGLTYRDVALINRIDDPNNRYQLGLHPFYDWSHCTYEIFGPLS